MLKQLAEQLADVIAPARCLACLREGSWLCQRCAAELPDFSQQCIVCEERRARGVSCAHHGTVPLTGVISAGAYTSEYVRRGVHWLKFRGVRAVAPVLAWLLARRVDMIAPLAQLQAEAVLIPIPLHARRKRARGFNQSLDIAQALSAQTGIPVQEVLQRTKSTASQAELPHELRQENVEKAFVIRAELPRKKYFILIDDVVTTGSTLMAAAEVLTKGKAHQVWGVTVARG